MTNEERMDRMRAVLRTIAVEEPAGCDASAMAEWALGNEGVVTEDCRRELEAAVAEMARRRVGPKRVAVQDGHRVELHRVTDGHHSKAFVELDHDGNWTGRGHCSGGHSVYLTKRQARRLAEQLLALLEES